MKFSPHEYQETAIIKCLENSSYGLFLDPGLGKTSIMLMVYKLLKARGFVKGMLVVAPLRATILVWPKEVQKWDEFKGLKVQVLHGPNKQKALDTPADIYVINPEGLEWLFRGGLFRVPSKKWPFDMLVIDESTMFKNTDSGRYHTLRPQLPKFKRRYILTGTPTPNNLTELFGQIYILDLGKSLGKMVTHFRFKYCFKDVYGWEVVKGADKLIYSKVAPITLRMSAEDYLTLPELIINDVYVRLAPKNMDHYKEMLKQLRTEFEFGRVNAVNAAVKAGKLRQITSGAVYTAPQAKLNTNPKLPKWQAIHEDKLDAVEELLASLPGQPVLLGYEYEHEAERLKRRFPHALSLGGNVSTHKLKQTEQAWNDGKVPLLLMQIDSGSLAMNLQGSGNNIILFTPTYKFQSYDQFIRRVWRQGHVTQRVRVHRILAENTIDEMITHEVLVDKAQGQKSLFKALEDYFKSSLSRT